MFKEEKGGPFIGYKKEENPTSNRCGIHIFQKGNTNSVEDLEFTLEDVRLRTISSLQEALEELMLIAEEVREKY